MEARAYDRYNRKKHSAQYDPIEAYCNLPEGVNAELIDGEIVMLAKPTFFHQQISLRIAAQFDNYLRGKQCDVAQDVNVRLDENARKPTVFGPDIVIVCDPSKIRPNGWVVGVPDLIVEILSPSNQGHDRITKFDRYMRAGVREYWIVDPEHYIVDVYILENGQYVNHPYGSNAKITVTVLDGCVIDLSDVFPDAPQRGVEEDEEEGVED